MNADFEARIRVVDQKVEKMEEEAKKKGSHTPQFLIKCDDIFSSDIDGSEKDGAPCLWIDTGSERHATHDASGEHTGDGKVVGEDVIVCMKYGSWGPLLQEGMLAGKVLDEINIHRLISNHGKQVTAQELTYENCLIKFYRQSGDHIIFSFGYSAVEDLKIKYDAKGTKTGQVGMKFDFSKLKVEGKS